MSKHMQITVTVRPYYKTGFEETYPRLARRLEQLAPDLVRGQPSLFALAGQLDQLLYRLEGTQLRGVLLRHRDALVKMHKSIQEKMADWNLSAADRILYAMEDVFDEIESQMD
ncbi:MAG: hypothetical protein GX443_03840 [Deltaproteobacteria bacterium]|nr:hypothetical protein [Deltaproteobacteria bacterium]